MAPDVFRSAARRKPTLRRACASSARQYRPHERHRPHTTLLSSTRSSPCVFKSRRSGHAPSGSRACGRPGTGPTPFAARYAMARDVLRFALHLAQSSCRRSGSCHTCAHFGGTTPGGEKRTGLDPMARLIFRRAKNHSRQTRARRCRAIGSSAHCGSHQCAHDPARRHAACRRSGAGDENGSSGHTSACFHSGSDANRGPRRKSSERVSDAARATAHGHFQDYASRRSRHSSLHFRAECSRANACPRTGSCCQSARACCRAGNTSRIRANTRRCTGPGSGGCRTRAGPRHHDASASTGRCSETRRAADQPSIGSRNARHRCPSPRFWPRIGPGRSHHSHRPDGTGSRHHDKF